MGGIISAGDIGSRLPGSEKRGLLGNIFMGMGREADQLRTQDAALGALTRGGSRMPIEAQERLLASAFPEEYFRQQIGGLPARREREALQRYVDNTEGQQALASGALRDEKAFNKEIDLRAFQQNMPDLPTPDPIPLGMGPPPMLGGMERPMDLPSVLPMDDVSRSIFTPGQRQEIEDYGVKKQGITEQADLARQAQADLRLGIPGFEKERVKAALTPQEMQSEAGRRANDFELFAQRLTAAGVPPAQISELARDLRLLEDKPIIERKKPDYLTLKRLDGSTATYNINSESGAMAAEKAVGDGATPIKDIPKTGLPGTVQNQSQRDRIFQNLDQVDKMQAAITSLLTAVEEGKVNLGIGAGVMRSVQETLGEATDILGLAKAVPALGTLVDGAESLLNSAIEVGGLDSERYGSYFNKELSKLKLLENALGVFMARSRDPQGRLLATNLDLALEDVNLTKGSEQGRVERLKQILGELEQSRKIYESQVGIGSGQVSYDGYKVERVEG